MPSLYHIDSSVNEGNMGMSNVSSDEESRLIEKLRKIETLFARTTNPGERQAAESALERIRRRLNELEKKYDGQFKVVFDAIRQLMEPPDSKRRIGFKAQA